MNINAEIVSKTSKKTGTVYTCLEIEIVPGYKKVVFLDKAEEALISLNYGE